jgi:hypothetical protein
MEVDRKLIILGIKVEEWNQPIGKNSFQLYHAKIRRGGCPLFV